MRAPKGFGRNYFSLAAIQAYSSATVLHGETTRTHTISQQRDRESESEAEADDSPDILECSSQRPVYPRPSGSCHCNCFFRRKTRNTIKNHPLPKRFQRPFRIANSSISPPAIAANTSTSTN